MWSLLRGMMTAAQLQDSPTCLRHTCAHRRTLQRLLSVPSPCFFVLRSPSWSSSIAFSAQLLAIRAGLDHNRGSLFVLVLLAYVLPQSVLFIMCLRTSRLFQRRCVFKSKPVHSRSPWLHDHRCGKAASWLLYWVSTHFKYNILNLSYSSGNVWNPWTS